MPKGQNAIDAIWIIRRSQELRPITLLQSSAKLISAVSNEELARVAQLTVSGQHRGLASGRHMSDHVIQVEGCPVEWDLQSCCTRFQPLFHLTLPRRFRFWPASGCLGRPTVGHQHGASGHDHSTLQGSCHYNPLRWARADCDARRPGHQTGLPFFPRKRQSRSSIRGALPDGAASLQSCREGWNGAAFYRPW